MSVCVVVFGQAGTGKSTEVARSFQESLFVVSDPNVLRPYESWRALHPEEGLKRLSFTHLEAAKDFDAAESMRVVVVPKSRLLPDGSKVRVNNKERVDEILTQFAQATLAGKAKSKGLVFDEWSEFAARALVEMQVQHSGWKVYQPFYAWHSDIIDTQRNLGVPFVFIHHAVEPQFENGDEGGGKVIAKGGPKMPTVKLVGQWCAAVDAVLHREVELLPDPSKTKDLLGDAAAPAPAPAAPAAPAPASDPRVPTAVRRVYHTESHPHWERKIRAFGLQPKETLDLPSLLRRAGFIV